MTLDYDYTLLFLIFLRMSGCILFNPIFARKNVPVLLRIGLSVMFTLFVYWAIPNTQSIEIATLIGFGIAAIKELLIGLVIGYIINLFLSVLILAGEFMDMQIGISMSKIYDPASNVSMPVSASIFNAMLIIIFFMTNSHLTLVEVFVHTAKAVPFGEFTFSPTVFQELALMFSTILIYAVKMSLPLLAAELITEMGVGLIMKAVPQINVFVVNLQLKILIGFVMIFLLIHPFASFLERTLTLMFDHINKVLFMLGG